MEIEIAEWDFNLDRCNDPIPFATFVPTMDLLELSKRNNNRLWVTLEGTGQEEYDGKSFEGVVDKSMANTPCKSDLSPLPTYYSITFPGAPYVSGVVGGTLVINKPLDVPPLTVLGVPDLPEAEPEYEQEVSEEFSSCLQLEKMDTASVFLLMLLVAIVFVIVVGN